MTIGSFIVLRRQKETTEGAQETEQGYGWRKCLSVLTDCIRLYDYFPYQFI